MTGFLISLPKTLVALRWRDDRMPFLSLAVGRTNELPGFAATKNTSNIGPFIDVDFIVSVVARVKTSRADYLWALNNFVFREREKRRRERGVSDSCHVTYMTES